MAESISAALLAGLTDRDLAILESLEQYRILSSSLLRRLHFEQTHANVSAAGRSTNRTMNRLERHGLVARLGQRVGGVRAGSSSLLWQLDGRGENLLRARSGRKQRRRFIEPSGVFVEHTLAIAEVATRLVEADRDELLELLLVQSEPSCWRHFLTRTGVTEWLKPDLYVVTAHGDFEDHAFIEVDLGTEHRPVLVRKAKAFQRYRSTGRHQEEHGVFPAVLWIAPDAARQQAIQAALRSDSALDPTLFRVLTMPDIPEAFGGSEPPKSSSPQPIPRGGTP